VHMSGTADTVAMHCCLSLAGRTTPLALRSRVCAVTKEKTSGARNLPRQISLMSLLRLNYDVDGVYFSQVLVDLAQFQPTVNRLKSQWLRQQSVQSLGRKADC